MTEKDLSKEMTVYDLAILMMKGFDRVDERFDRLEERVSIIEGNYVTKDDLKDFATKNDLKRFATKEDLKDFATKDDLKEMEYRLSQKIDKNYLAVNRRIDLIAEKVS